MYVFIGAEKYSCSIIVSIFSKYVIVKYRKPALKKFKFTRGKFTFTLEENMKSIFYQFISRLKLIAWRIYIKMPQKKHLWDVCFSNPLKFSKFLLPFKNCSSELLVCLQNLVVIPIRALCQQSNLLKANNKVSVWQLVPLLFKWIPLWLQCQDLYLNWFIFASLLPHSFLVYIWCFLI